MVPMLDPTRYQEWGRDINPKGEEGISCASRCGPELPPASHYYHHETILSVLTEGFTEVAVVCNSTCIGNMGVTPATASYPPLLSTTSSMSLSAKHHQVYLYYVNVPPNRAFLGLDNLCYKFFKSPVPRVRVLLYHPSLMESSLRLCD